MDALSPGRTMRVAHQEHTRDAKQFSWLSASVALRPGSVTQRCGPYGLWLSAALNSGGGGELAAAAKSVGWG